MLHVAQREMHKLEHRALTSMHLLIGFCSVGVEPLRTVLRAKEVGEEWLCQRLRQRARLLVPTEQEGFGISQGTYFTLANAAERVQSRRGDKLTAQDLLAGMLAWREAQAVQILAGAAEYPQGSSSSNACPIRRSCPGASGALTVPLRRRWSSPSLRRVGPACPSSAPRTC